MTPAQRFEMGYKQKKQRSIMGSVSDKRLKFKNGKQKEFLKNVVQEFGSQRKLAEFIGYSTGTVRGWISEEYNIPNSVFLKLLNKYYKYKFFSKFIEKELDWNWGKVKGGKKRVRQIKNLDSYLKYVRSFNKKHEQIRKCSAITIENNLLEELKKDNVDLVAILAICTMTDGHLEIKGNSYRISFSSSDVVFVNFITALLFELSDFIPSVYGPYKKSYNICVSDALLGKNLTKLSPEYKTYALEKDNQPTINFFNKMNMSTKVWGMWFAFSADGSISLPKNNKPILEITCYNRSLCGEWKTFLANIGIFGNISKQRSAKEGVSGIRIARADSIKTFYDLGGFIDGIKISSKSKKYCGLEKNKLLKTCVEIKSAPGRI